MHIGAKAHPLDQAIRAIPAAWFRPDPRIYWADMLTSAVTGWVTFALAVSAAPAARAAFLCISVFALYRAVLFIHELTHLTRRDVPGFRVAWNALVGVPLLIPSFLYEGVHTDHHRQHSYGTTADPEYVPFGRRPPLLIATYALGSALVPLLLILRFGLVAPLSWIIPPLRRLTVARMSALVINQAYVRRAPMGLSALVEEAASCVLVWAAIVLWWTGVVPLALIGCWVVVTSAASTINAVRTLAAHRYDHDTDSSAALTMVDQLLDSCTIAPRSGVGGWCGIVWRGLWAPVGLRFHALHHWIPSLPYHNLARAHRVLATALGADAPYTATQYPAIAPVVGDLVRRSRRQRRG